MTHTEAGLPDAMYSCRNWGCSTIPHYPSSLYFWDGKYLDHPEFVEGCGWYCEGCLEKFDRSIEGRPRLDREIKRREHEWEEALLAASVEEA